MKSEQAKVREELAISLEELQRDLKLRYSVIPNIVAPQHKILFISQLESSHNFVTLLSNWLVTVYIKWVKESDTII